MTVPGPFPGLALAAALLLSCTAPAVAQAPLAARDLARGEVLAAADIVSGGEDVPVPVGWVTRRVVSAGQELRAPAIAPPKLVTAGETVQVLWRQGTLELRVRGRAMGSAAEGERVLVHVDSRRRLEGVAIAPRLIRVEPRELRR